MRIYLKKGNRNYKENRMINDLKSAIDKKMAEDPEFERKFVPAKDFDELKALHDRFVPTDVEFTETKNENRTQMSTSDKEDIQDTTKVDDSSFSGEFIDPLNRESPVVRDYVLSEDPLEENATKTEKPNPFQTFDEPTSFQEAFDIPDSAQMGDDKKVNSKESSDSKQDKKDKSSSSSKPLNPSFDDLSSGKKKRSTKKFAKYIVETLTMLSEKGLVWFANKDITEAKLLEYEASGEINLNILLQLDDGQEATVREFFKIQCANAEALLKITPEEQADLIDSLSEVMLEKGFAPTPTQELLLQGATIVGRQVITMIALKSQTASVLNQLREINGSDVRPVQQQEPISQAVSDEPMTIKEEFEKDQEIRQQPVDSESFESYSTVTPTELALSEEVATKE